MTLEGLEVLDLEPDFASLPTIRGTRYTDRVFLSEANQVISYRGKHPIHSLYFRWNMRNRVDLRALEDFFFDRKGKWGTFWTPSWHGELYQRASLLNTGTTLSIEPVEYATLFLVDTTNVFRLGNYIFLLHQDGTLWTPKVTGVSGTDPEILQLGEAATKDWNVGECMIGFMYCVRFLDDELQLEMQGPNAATVSLAMQEVTNVDSEADNAGDPPIEGIAFYDEFESYDVAQTENLNRGWGWLAAWETEVRYDFDNIFVDDLSTYSGTVNGTTVVGNGGTGTFVAS